MELQYGLVYVAQQTSVVHGYNIRKLIKTLGYEFYSTGGLYGVRCGANDETALMEILREHKIPCGLSMMSLTFE